jgi:uncharacterized protein (TIGR02453 family)
MNQQGAFQGFSKKTLTFFNDLQLNNNKNWFENHRSDYNQFILQPFKSIVIDLTDFMLSIDDLFEVTPAVNKTISRIYRDTRFSKDKSLFRTRMWFTFKRSGKDWKDAPAFFFQISIHSYCFGMGFYSASPETMQGLRDAIDHREEEFLKAISFYSQQTLFELQGELYKRIFDRNKPSHIQEWYQRRNLYLICNREIDQLLFSPKLVDDLRFAFKLLEPLYHFLWRLKIGD